MTENEIITAQARELSAEEIKQKFEKAKITEKVEFIEWYLRYIHWWEPQNVNFKNYSIQEICEITGKSESWVKYILKEYNPNECFTRQFIALFCANLPIAELGKITGMPFEKIDEIKILWVDHPNCSRELLILYFEIQEILNGRELNELLNFRSGPRKRKNLTDMETQNISAREKVIEKIAVFIKNKKKEAFYAVQKILDIDSKHLKRIIGYYFKKECLERENCLYKEFLQ